MTLLAALIGKPDDPPLQPGRGMSAKPFSVTELVALRKEFAPYEGRGDTEEGLILRLLATIEARDAEIARLK
jgi:hypothetical protein